MVVSRLVRKFYHFFKAVLAVVYYRFPSRKLILIGVTGTDGKTTTVSMIYEILQAAGKRVAKISTVSADINGQELDTGFHTTTPGPFLIQKFLRQMVDSGIEYAVLEVSSHALDQFRVWGCHFAVGVLTNITPEHLDYHQTMEEYRNSKAKLFSASDVLILNSQDKSFPILVNTYKGVKKIISYPIKKLGKKLQIIMSGKFPEPYNYLNAQAAVMATGVLEISEEIIVRALKDFNHVSGRLEKIKNSKGLNIIVDFAHTPNALRNVLKALRPKNKNKLICVFGCAGERDKSKRFEMGKIAAKYAEVCVITAEDPRSEDVNRIIEEISLGAVGGGGKKGVSFFQIPQRGRAIYQAINVLAVKGDAVVICGKGHEKSMAYGSIEYPWSDQRAVQMALSDRVMKIRIRH